MNWRLRSACLQVSCITCGLNGDGGVAHSVMVNGITSFMVSSVTCEMPGMADFLGLILVLGITTAVTAWGVTQFVMTSRSPWREFPRLKSHLAQGQPPYNEHSGSLERAGVLLDQLEQEDLVITAAPELLELEKQHTSRSSEGFAVVQLPEWVSERQQLDIHVANRKIVSEKGKSLLSTIAE